MNENWQTLVELVSASKTVAVEGNFGAGKSTLVRRIAEATKVTLAPEFDLPTRLFEHPQSGQAIYPLQDVLRMAAVPRLPGRPNLVERYAVSAIGHQFAAGTRFGDDVTQVYRRLMVRGVLPMPDLTIVVLRPWADCISVLEQRRWSYDANYIEQIDGYLREFKLPLDLTGQVLRVEQAATGAAFDLMEGPQS